MNGLPKNLRVHVAVQVELEGELARIAVNLEGKPFVRWEGPQASVSQGWLTFPNPQCLGFSSMWGTRTVFHTASVRVLSGEGRLLPSSP